MDPIGKVRDLVGRIRGSRYWRVVRVVIFAVGAINLWIGLTVPEQIREVSNALGFVGEDGLRWGIVAISLALIAVAALIRPPAPGFNPDEWAVSINGRLVKKNPASKSGPFQMEPEASEPKAPEPGVPDEDDLWKSQAYIRGRTFRLVDLLPPNRYLLRNRTFEDCEIHGPALIASVNSTMEHVTFLADGVPHNDPGAWFWQLPIGAWRVGGITMEQCVIRNCRLVGIALVGTKEDRARFMSAYAGPPPGVV